MAARSALAFPLAPDESCPALAAFSEGTREDLSVDGIKKSFAKRMVLDGVSFAIRQGEAIALVGANGCGKSTLLKTCLGLVRPERGRVTLLGHNLFRTRGRKLRRLRGRVAMVWQRHNLVARLSALSNVIHGAQARSDSPLLWTRVTTPASVRRRALECLAAVGVVHLADARVDRLSGGESQRVAIARALMQEPAMLFADEPAASLDPKAGEEILELLFRQVTERRLTLVMVSHDLDHAIRYAHRVIGLKNGRIAIDAPTNGLRKEELRPLYAD
jgi:phosphonate transport system ATP-binding protein